VSIGALLIILGIVLVIIDWTILGILLIIVGSSAAFAAAAGTDRRRARYSRP
jgi:ABC-type uncharacterized transport system permease subunit